MKPKQRNLIQYLSNQHKPSKSSELATYLNVSSRTVKNYVKELNAMYPSKLILSSKDGYEINRQISISSLWSENEEIPQTYEDRAFFVVRELILGHASHLDIFEICDALYISYSTAKSLITQMNKTFANYNVAFFCENDCVKIHGDERSKRKLISYVIAEGSSTSYLDLHELIKTFPNSNIEALYELVETVFQKHSFYINDFARLNLLLHLIIIINRKTNGNALPSEYQQTKQNDLRNKQITNELCDAIEELYQIQLEQLERGEVYILVRSNANYSLPTSENELVDLVGEEIVDLTMYYIQQINNLYMIDLNSETFRTPFALHLNNLKFRSDVNSFTPNPMAEMIKTNSPIVFDIAIYISLDLNTRWNTQLTIDETAFIAMHLGVEIERQNQNTLKIPTILVCPDYRDMQLTLTNQLLLNFGNKIKIVYTLSSAEDLYNLSDDFNESFHPLVFSTIPIHQSFPLKVLQISPFNIQTQKDRINDLIEENNNRYQINKLKNYFPIFFEEDLFTPNSELETKEEILKYMSDKLLEKNYVEKHYLSKVIERENASTTAFGNIAIPHCVQMDAFKTSISVALSKRGFTWGNHIVYVVLLLSINKADKRNFRYLYESLISVFSDFSIIEKIKVCETLEEFKEKIYYSISIED